jgi:peptidyl-prolyl cis-trans isomerase SurA
MKAKGMKDEDIKAKINKKDAGNLSITHETIKKPMFDVDNRGLEWQVGSSTTTDGEGGAKNYTVVTELIPVLPKPLDESRGYVVADYQEKLEKDWIQSLRQKYPVSINESVLKSLVK